MPNEDPNKQPQLDTAFRIARGVLAGSVPPNKGCAQIGQICQELKYPPELGLFALLAHEQMDHEHLGITAESCIPDILEACEALVK